MEQVSDEEVEHAGEEADSDEEDQDLDQMFGAWLGELEKLTKVLTHTHAHAQTHTETLTLSLSVFYTAKYAHLMHTFFPAWCVRLHCPR